MRYLVAHLLYRILLRRNEKKITLTELREAVEKLNLPITEDLERDLKQLASMGIIIVDGEEIIPRWEILERVEELIEKDVILGNKNYLLGYIKYTIDKEFS